MTPIKIKPCSFCGGTNHTKLTCYEYRKTQPKGRTRVLKPLSARIGKKAAEDRETRLNWIQKHGGIHATWECYLKISPMCIRFLTIETLTIEHVVPKGRGSKYRHDINNLRPACQPCNSQKGSSTLEYLSKTYPHLLSYIT